MPRKGFIVEFQPLPLPQTPPDAPGGCFLYLSPEWHKYVMGIIRVLEFKRFWKGATEDEYYQILHWVYEIQKQCQALPEPEKVVEYRYVEVDSEGCEDGKCDLCDCDCDCDCCSSDMETEQGCA